MKTFTAKSVNIIHNWYIIDANSIILGRLATKIAHYLQGKHKAEYTPHVDTGDYIIVLNANKIIVTGNKRNEKIYYRHTGYVGGLKKETLEEMLKKYPERVIEKAVKGMLPKGSLGRTMYKKLKIYSSNKHNHIAQNPTFINF